MRFLWQFASFSGIMLFLSCVAPTIAFLSVNVEHFTNRQIRNAVMAVMAFGLIAWFVVALISEPINSLLPFYWFGLQVSDILSCLLCGIFLTVFGERTIFENIHKLYLRIIAVSAIFTVVILISIVLSHAAVVAILLIYLLFSLYDLKKKYKTVRYPLVSDTHTHTHEAAGTSGATSPRFARRPNVWLLFLEAIHSFEAAKEIYGIDASEAESFLRRQGFRIYAPFYSTTSWTVGSACALLTRYPFFDQFLPEYPIVLRTFRDNGYRMQVFDSGAYVFGRWEWLMDYASFALRGAGRKLFRSFLPLFAQSSLLRKAIGISDPYTSDVHTEAAYTDILNKVRLHGFVQDSSARPVFNIVRFGAKHTENSSTWEENKKSWPGDTGLLWPHHGALQEMASLIVERDPEALVAVVADHGGKEMGFQWIAASSDLNAALKENGMTMPAICRDYFDVLCAIRWGSASIEYDIKTQINLFGYIFSYLSDDNVLPKNLQEEVSVCTDHIRGPNWIFAENAHPLNRAVPYSLRKQQSVLQRAVAIDPWNLKIKNIFRTADVVPCPRADSLDSLRAALCGGENEEAALAMNRLRRQVQTAPSAEVLLDWGWRCAAMGRLADAEKSCLESLKTAPENTRGLWLLCLLQAERNAGAEAAATALRLCMALADRGGSPDGEKEGPDVVAGFRILVLSLIHAHMWEDAGSVLAEHGIPHGSSLGVWGVFCRALCEERLGNPRGALEVLLAAQSDYAADPACLARIQERIGLLALSCRWKEPEFRPVRQQVSLVMREMMACVESSGRFDADFYHKTYLEPQGVSMRPLTHFFYHGVFEGLNPSPGFNTFFYLARYGDVFRQGENPFVHYLAHGAGEGRQGSLHLQEAAPERRGYAVRAFPRDPAVTCGCGKTHDSGSAANIQD